jgi:hypothetical protein
VARFLRRGAGDAKLRAAEWVELTGREPEGLNLRLTAQVTLRGRVVMEAAQAQADPKGAYGAAAGFRTWADVGSGSAGTVSLDLRVTARR